MKTLTIAHLYYDLMNLYGEQGNLKALITHLEHQDIKVNLVSLSLNEPKHFQDYDFIYIGSGSKESLLLALNDLQNYQAEIKEAYANQTFFLVTGNALCLFGKELKLQDNTTVKGLNLFSYTAQETAFTIVGEQMMQDETQIFVGFTNRNWLLEDVSETTWFTVQKGTGNHLKQKEEGIHMQNFYGTFLIGPLLIRNPFFTHELLTKLLKMKEVTYIPQQNKWEEKAYETYKKNFL